MALARRRNLRSRSRLGEGNGELTNQLNRVIRRCYQPLGMSAGGNKGLSWQSRAAGSADSEILHRHKFVPLVTVDLCGNWYRPGRVRGKGNIPIVLSAEEVATVEQNYLGCCFLVCSWWGNFSWVDGHMPPGPVEVSILPEAVCKVSHSTGLGIASPVPTRWP